MKLIGVYCECGATVLDSGTECVHCHRPYTPEVIAMGRQNKTAVSSLLKANVEPEAAVEQLAKATREADQTPWQPGIVSKILYWIREFHVPGAKPVPRQAMKLIGLRCQCGALAMDDGTECPECKHPYPAEILAIGREHREAADALAKAGVEPDVAVEQLATATREAKNNPAQPGIVSKIQYWLSEFHNPGEAKGNCE